MKIKLSLVPLIAVVLMGCGEDQRVSRTCLAPGNVVVDSGKCEAMYQQNGNTAGNPPWFYYWYYMNQNNGTYFAPRPGVVFVPRGGSYVAPEGVGFSAGESVGIARGGFGSSAHASAGE